MESLMLLFPLFFAIFLFDISVSQEAELSKLEAHFYNKCNKNTGNNIAFDKLRNDAFELHKYFEYSFEFMPQEKDTFCNSHRANLKIRIKEVAKDLYPCLNSNEKFLAEFIKESFSEVLHFLCHNNGEYTRRFFSAESQQCRNTIQAAQNNDLENCLNRIFAPTSDSLRKGDLCDDLTVARKCFATLIEVNCPHARDLKNLNEIFFNFVRKPCNNSVTYLLTSSLSVEYFLRYDDYNLKRN